MSFVSDFELERQHSVLLAALYLRGLSRFAEPKRPSWHKILSKLRLECATFGTAPKALRRHGFDLEGLLLADSKLISKAEDFHARLRILTPVDSCYPARWLERLGSSAPPAVWWNGNSWRSGSGITIVGTRQVSRGVESWARNVGSAAAESGHLVVSGGAIGCDKAAIQGALKSGGILPSAAVSILPCGVNQSAQRNSAVLSVCEPDAPFTPAQAMERNTLLYAWSEWAIVAHSRFREGGTWAGCTDALRRRLCRVAISRQSNELAVEALCALGAKPIRQWGDFEQIRDQSQPGVLELTYPATATIESDSGSVRENFYGYGIVRVA